MPEDIIPIAPVRRYHSGGDPWGRSSYQIPATAVIGSSDCGDFPDSPAPSKRVLAELHRFGEELHKAGIKFTTGFSPSGNCCMVKRWLKVSKEDFPKAFVMAEQWLKDHNSDTHYVHSAKD